MKRLTLADVPKGDKEGKYMLQFMKGTLQGRKDLLLGKTISHEKVKKIMGFAL